MGNKPGVHGLMGLGILRSVIKNSDHLRYRIEMLHKLKVTQVISLIKKNPDVPECARHFPV